MHAPSPDELVRIWDAGTGRDHTSRALLLAGAHPDRALLLAGANAAPPAAGLADLTVGTRDQLLLDLRARLFGSRVEARARCPQCAASLDVVFDLTEIHQGGQSEPPPDRIDLEMDGYQLALRPPTSRDLTAATAAGDDFSDARARLLALCVTVVRAPDQAASAADLPAAVQAAVVDALAAADPQAEIRLALDCAVCDHRWETHFDIVSYLWAEIEERGRRTLRDVHTLATAYGWSEAETLALPVSRRQRYLELVADG